MRKTKIVCTLGPATDNYNTLKAMIKAGMNVARINMSHGSYEEHKARIDNLKRARKELMTPVSLLLDTKGPEIRIRTFEKGKVALEEGQQFTLTADDIVGDNTRVSITFPDLSKYLKKNDSVLINDGLIELKVTEIINGDVVCVVVNGGELSNRKSINLPGIDIDMPYVSDIDYQDILYAIQMNADYLALSFVRSGDDVKRVRNILELNGGHEIQVISKIENRSGVKHIDDILSLSDGIMVARGDMGVEIPFEELPAIQKSLIKACMRSGKKVITATQMLESMIHNPRPTRAEISDVANAIYDGTSAIMLSGETAAGQYPVQAVKTMAKIAEKTEESISYFKRFKQSEYDIKNITNAVSHSTVAAAYDLNAKAIITVTKSGYTARKVSRFRPSCIIIAATTSEKVYNQLALNWGVVPTMASVQATSDALFAHSMRCALNTGLVNQGDLVVMTGATSLNESGSSNTMRIEII